MMAGCWDNAQPINLVDCDDVVSAPIVVQYRIIAAPRNSFLRAIGACSNGRAAEEASSIDFSSPLRICRATMPRNVVYVSAR
jgi:hypothetical protein